MRKLTEKQKATVKEKKRRERGIAKNRKIAARIVAANGKLARTKGNTLKGRRFRMFRRGMFGKTCHEAWKR